MGSIDWILELPRRVRSRQDAADVLQAFEREANAWIWTRQEDDLGHVPHVFYPTNSTRVVTELEIKELSELLGTDMSGVIPMRAALNALRRAIAERSR